MDRAGLKKIDYEGSLYMKRVRVQIIPLVLRQ